MAHKPWCADKTKWKWTDKKWVTRDRGGGNKFREQWGTKVCKSCKADLGDAMIRSMRERTGRHERKKK